MNFQLLLRPYPQTHIGSHSVVKASPHGFKIFFQKKKKERWFVILSFVEIKKKKCKFVYYMVDILVKYNLR